MALGVEDADEGGLCCGERAPGLCCLIGLVARCCSGVDTVGLLLAKGVD